MKLSPFVDYVDGETKRFWTAFKRVPSSLFVAYSTQCNRCGVIRTFPNCEMPMEFVDSFLLISVLIKLLVFLYLLCILSLH